MPTKMDHNDQWCEVQEVEHVNEFVFLSSAVSGSSADVRRIALASSAFGKLRAPMWSKQSICNALKVRLYNALFLPIATYAAET